MPTGRPRTCLRGCVRCAPQTPRCASGRTRTGTSTRAPVLGDRPGVPFLVELATAPDTHDRAWLVNLLAYATVGNEQAILPDGMVSLDRLRHTTSWPEPEYTAWALAAYQAVQAALPVLLPLLEDDDDRLRGGNRPPAGLVPEQPPEAAVQELLGWLTDPPESDPFALQANPDAFPCHDDMPFGEYTLQTLVRPGPAARRRVARALLAKLEGA